jgi:two-component system, NtrC family, nitrogen regulation response regulator GlnG
VRDPHSTVSALTGSEDAVQSCIAVRVLAHPDAKRVGDWAPLFDARGDRTALVCRSAPPFRASDGTLTGPLASTRITRRPLELTRAGDTVRLRVDADTGAFVNGSPVDGARVLSADELKAGVVVLFGKYLVLWIGWLELHDLPAPIPGIIGESTAMRYLRRQIHSVAATDVPVLLRGETGVGKELVAAAIHDLSTRAGATYVPVNAAGIPPTMAASELFGHKRGAFTGAFEDRKGYFSQADGGTLFLDEIGDVSFDVQALLLRAVQHGVIQPLGGTTRKVDVRIVAATDSDLESAVALRQFREPLLRRFSFEIHVPALRTRRDDVGVLFLHLVAERLRAMGDSRPLLSAEPGADPWIPAEFVAALALHDWPGNVRELSNVTLHFVLENRGRARAKITEELRRLVRPRGPVAAPAGIPEAKDASEIGDAEIVAALRAEKFSRPRAAQRLGVSKSYLYKRLERLDGVRPAAEIPREEIQSALDANHGDVGAAAERLEISTRALLLQLRRVRTS